MKCIIITNEYGQYCIPEISSHRKAAQTVLSGKMHEIETMRYISQNCSNVGVIHAGCFFGDALPFLSERFRFVWAFEPVFVNWFCADVTKKINELKNVKLIDRALGDEKGAWYMKTHDEGGKHLGGGCCIANDGTESVQITTIDDIVKPEVSAVSLIHLDIEGYELKALRGGIATIRKYKPMLILEFLKCDLEHDEWFIENILELGYKRTKKLNSNMVFEYK
jgi:FkbM family methyltransferase